MAYRKSEKLKDNISAIRTAFEIERSGREATEKEKATLRKYSGFGGLKFILNPCGEEDDVAKWSRSDRPLFNATRELYALLKENARDVAEYKRFVTSIRNSILSAFYTPVKVVQAIAQVFRRQGVEVKSYLDPSAGKGTFVEAFKQSYHNMKATAYEKDIITGKVLKALYPGEQVHVDGFETVGVSQQGKYDLVSSNIPFGDISVFDDGFARSGNAVKAASTKTIHNYFFLKALEQVREGGFVAFITSRGFMDSPSNNSIREELIKNARLVGAYRLPDGLFADEAGTEVGSDLVILQKYTGYDSTLDPDSLAFCEVEKGFKTIDGEDYSDISLNSHWWKSMMAPDSEAFISNREERGTDPYGKPTLVFTHDGGMDAVSSLLTEYMSRDLHGDYVDYYKSNVTKSEQVKQEPPKPRQQHPARQEQPVQLSLFDLWADDTASQEEQGPPMEPRPYKGEVLPHYRNGIVVEDDGQLGHLTNIGHDITFTPIELSEDQSGRMKLYVKIRDAYEQLYKKEAEQREEQPDLRKDLNTHYDSFIRKYGNLNERKNARLFLMDVQGRDTLTLENSENGHFVKADIFLRPVSFNINQDGHVETAVDALSASLNRTGSVDLEYMASISDFTGDELRDQLKERIYYNPMDGEYEISDKFLAGNVVEKIEFFERNYGKEHLDSNDDEVARSYHALLAVRPRPITYDELDFNFGERWMPKTYFSEFASEFFEADIKIGYAPQLDEFVVDVSDQSAKLTQEFAVTGETKTYDGEDLLRHALYNTVPVINKCIGYKPNGDPIMGPDHEKIQLAASKIDQIRDGFTEWIDRHPDEWKKDLADMYNRKYNCFVRASYDGGHQTFPGLDLKGLAVSKYKISDIYKSQKDCVWMLLQNGGGVCDHEVGTGKTMTMCIAAHEMKRLGLAHKPIIIGMKANVAEIAATYQAAYPADRILYATQKDFSDRQNFFNRMKNNDYDCIIMSHDQFTMIPQSADIQRKVLYEEIWAIDEALEVYERQGHSVSSRMRSGLEKRKQNLETQLQTLNAVLAHRADDVVDFKTMGIDHIFIDESQAFKNLAFTTRDSRVAGLGDPKGSQRARNLQYAIRTIQERTGRDLGATFLSGTTISNSLTELYLLFKYLRPKAMSMQDINSFDAWAAVFARKSRDYEINVAGSIVMKERFRQFIKVPELGAFYNEITDYKTAADVGLERPGMDVQLVNIQPTEDQQDFQQRLLQFAESGDAELIFRDSLSDNEDKAKMLIVTNLGKKCSLSPRLVNPEYREGDDTKIGVAAKNISDIYYQYNEQRGTQFVFCDLSTPKKGEWNVYQELKDRLVGQYNIPADQIQFIQDASTEKKKKEFIDRMNRGDIRVMIGSTTMLGTGVNAQQRAVAVHHLDLPWRPSDMEQRNGRARRKGNEVARDYANNEVKVFVYAVERSLDSYNFYLLQAKSEFIRQMKTGALGKRSFDQGGEDENNGMPFAEYVAITSGNTDLLERAKLEKRILGMDAERKAFYKQQQVVLQKLNFSNEQIRHFDAALERLNTDKAAIEHALAGLIDGGADAFAELRRNHAVISFHNTDDPQLSRIRFDLTQENPYGDYLQKVARQEVNGEVTVARLVSRGLDWPLVVSSKTEYNPATGVSRWVGNKFAVIGESGLHYTINNGKIPYSDKRLAASYPYEALARIPAVIKDQEQQRQSYVSQIPELERIANKQWEKSEQLKDLKEQLQALDRKIQQDMDGKLIQAAEGMKPEDMPFKITQRSGGRDPWELEFKVSDYPYLNHVDRDAMEEKYHGSFRVSEGVVTGRFRHQYGAEEAMKVLSKLNATHRDDVKWLKAAAKDARDDSCIPSVHRLRVLGYDRFGRPIGGKNRQHLNVVSLGDYKEETVRALAHGVKNGNSVAMDVAATAMAKALQEMPEFKKAVLVGMPGHKGYGGYAQRLARRVSELTGVKYVEALNSGEHESLYEWKKEHPGEPMPELFFTEDDQYRIPKGKTPVIIDNVIDTGHTAWAAMEALEAQPVLLTIGSTGREGTEGHDIKVGVSPKGLEYIKSSTPEGVGLTGLSREELDDMLQRARSGEEYDARRELRRKGIDWYTGQPGYLVEHITGKWDMAFSDELEAPLTELTAKGSSDNIFTKEELHHLSKEDRDSFDELVKDVDEKSKHSYSYQHLGDKRRLMVVYEYLKEKAAAGIKQEALRQEQDGKLHYDVAANKWSGIPSDMKVYCNGEPDRIREIYGSTPNDDIDLVFYKAEREEDSHAFARVWVDDHQAETPAKIVVELEKEGVNVGLHGERGHYVDFSTWDEAVQFEQHVRDIERQAHEPKESPMMRQYHDLKAKHPDAMLLFRVGDFYESYEGDAVESARILGVTLMHRHPTDKADSPKEAMAGFPHHALDVYLPKLIRAGKRVAICDQLEAPKKTARRGSTEVMQPSASVRLQMVETMNDVRTALPLDAMLRDALIERMREAGIKVNTDVAEGESVLARNPIGLRLMSGGKDGISDAPIFFSNAQRAVESIRQDRATPDQWLHMIERNGGIKAGEDRWTGLSEWLSNSEERTLTRQQVLEYIAENHIQIEEVHYAADIEADWMDNPVYAAYLREFKGIISEFPRLYDEADARYSEFVARMRDKYGEEWEYDYSEEDANEETRLLEERAKYDGGPGGGQSESDLAFEQMAAKYGSSFEEAFEVKRDHYGDYYIQPTEEYRDADYVMSAAARRILGYDERMIDETRLAYTTEGLENRREIALTVPTIEPYGQSDEIHFGDAGNGRAVAWIRFGETVGQHERTEREIQDVIRSMPSADNWREVTYYTEVPGYRNFYNLNRRSLSYSDCILEKDGKYFIHFNGESPRVMMNGEKNIAALKRVGGTFGSLSDAVGAYNEYVARRDRFVEEKTLVIDEIQSLRHQDGRAKGYDKESFNTVADEVVERFSVTRQRVENDPYDVANAIQRYDASLAERLRQSVGGSGIPAAPFDKNWHELAMKRMLRYAAENGYDRVAWTTGNQQAERYSLGEYIDHVTAEPYEAMSLSEVSGIGVRLHTQEKASVDLFVTRDGIIRSGGYGKNENYFVGQPLAKVVGKSLSDKILAAQERQRFDGGDLRVGADGMKGFYDVMLVNFMEKYGRQWGVHTEDVELGKLNVEGKMHSVAVTPRMREDVRKGQPMFFKSGNGQVYGFVCNNEIYVDRSIATSEAPIHEYTHLWAEVMRQQNPKEWANIVSLMKDCPGLWQEVRERYSHLHDENDIAEEVLAHYSGKRGHERLTEEVGRRKEESGKTIFDAISEALDRLWGYVADFLHIHYTSKEQVADQVLRDLLKGVNPLGHRLIETQEATVAPSRRLTAADREAGGALVDHLAKMGIAVHTDYRENRRILKAAEQDHSEEGRVRHFKTRNGTTYGFAYKGELHLDLRKMDAELPLHEYAHLWCEAMRRINPDNWNSVVSVIKDDAASWQFVRAAYPELHDADDIAEEVIARYSGKRGAERLQDELERMSRRDANYGSRWGNIFQNISKAIQDFWKHTGDSLNIRYSSAEDVYDQILNDFARHVNPVAKTEKWLKDRDRQYANAVETGNIEEAKALFNDALREHVGNGITPFIAVDGYRGKLDRLAREVKHGSESAVSEAASLMAPLIPDNAVLVPAPSHSGHATDMLLLANAISGRTGMPVADVLTGDARERQYDVKRRTGRPLGSEVLGVRLSGDLPNDRLPVVIDNVVNSGNTAEACVKALGKGVVVTLASAVSQECHVSSLKSLEPVVYDKKGELVPLSERFSLKNKYLGRVMNYRPLGEAAFQESPVAAEPLVVDIRRGSSHGYESYLGSKAVFDAVQSLAGSRQKTIAGYENPNAKELVFVGTHALVMHHYDKENSGHFARTDGIGNDAVFRLDERGDGYHSLDALSPRLIRDGYQIAFIGREKVKELLSVGEHETLQSLSHPTVRSAVQLDLFSDPPMTKGNAREPVTIQTVGHPAKDASRDLTALHLRTLSDGEQCYVERRYRENGFFSFVGGDVIDSAEDIAFIFKSLEDQSVENSFLAMVKDGKPLVIHLGIGTYNEVPVPIEKALVAFNELKPEKVWFVHNHPSGSLKASFLDMKMHQRMQEVFGSAVQPSIIIDTTSGKYGEYTDAYCIDQSLSVGDESRMVPVPTYQFDRQVFSKGWNPEQSTASSAASVASFISSHRLGERDKLSLIVIDQAQHITGNVFLPWNTTRDIVKDDSVGVLAAYVHQMGGNRCIIYGSEDGVRMTDTRTMTKLSSQLKTFGVRLEDVMSVSRSAFQEGIYYAKEQDTGYMTQHEKQLADLLGNGGIDFVQRTGAPLKVINDMDTCQMAYIREITCRGGHVSIDGAIDNDGVPSYIKGLGDLCPDGIGNLFAEVRDAVQWQPELNLTIDQALMVAKEHRLYDAVEKDLMEGMEPELALQKHHIMPTAEKLAEIEMMNDPDQLPPVDAVRLLLDKAIPHDGDVLELDMGGARLDLQYRGFGWQELDDVKYIKHVGDGYVAGNGEQAIDVNRLASGPDGEYFVEVLKDNIKQMEDKTMEEKKQEEVQEQQQEQQTERKKRGWNIDYTKYSMPEGMNVEKAQVFKLNKGENAGKYAVSAVIDGQRKTQVLYKNDVDAYFSKDEQGCRKATAEQLVAKYFSPNTLKQPIPVKEENVEKQQPRQAIQEQTRQKQETRHLGTYDVPVWALAALQNGTDAYDGLEESDIAEIEHFQEQFDGSLSFDIHMEEKNEFNQTPAFGGAGETVKVDVYSFVEKVERAQAEVRENLEEEQVASEQQKEKEEKQQEDEKKEEKQDVSDGLALQTALLAGALHAASERDGVWMNKDGKQAPAFLSKDTKVSPFNSMMMALHSDANGYRSNIYTSFAAAKREGISVRGKEKGLPYNWYDWDKFVNKYNKNDVIDRTAYLALPPQERELYHAQGKKDMKPIFNIDQTTLPMVKKEEYKQLVQPDMRESATDVQAERMKLLEKMTAENPDTMKLFRVGDNYEIYGAEAEKAAGILGLSLVRPDGDTVKSQTMSVSFPVEELDSHLPKLVQVGNQVAICDKVEDARLGLHTTEGEVYAASDRLAEAIRQSGGTVNTGMAFTQYDREKNVLNVASHTSSVPGQEMTLAMERAGDVYRAAVAYTGTPDRLNRGARLNMLPEDREKYDRLVQELTAGVMMTRQGLPATISRDNRPLIPYWERELKEDPKLLDAVERDVNKAVEVLDKISAGKEVDYAVIRGERPATSVSPRMYTIASELATIPNVENKQVVIVRDQKNRNAAVILPAGASLEKNNEVPGMNKNRFVIALKRQGIDDVQFYNAGGALGLNQSNEFFADKQVEVAHLKQYDLVPDETVDLSEEIARTGKIEIEKVSAIKNDQNDWVFYVKPAGGEAVTIQPEAADLGKFFSAIQTEKSDAVREEMGQKYYMLAQQHPELKQDFLMPKVENVDLDRIKSVHISKDKYDDKKVYVSAVVDDNSRLNTRIDRDSPEWQRFWLVDDKAGYKVALAAKLFEAELTKGQEKAVEQNQEETVKDDKEVTAETDEEQEEDVEEEQTQTRSFRR